MNFREKLIVPLMHKGLRYYCLLAAALLVMLLVITQTAAIAHAYEHDPGAPQDQLCAFCVAASHVLTGCADSGLDTGATLLARFFGAVPVPLGRGLAALSARQRGPPASP